MNGDKSNLGNKIKTGEKGTIRTEVWPEDKDDLACSGTMREYAQGNPGWLLIVK